MAYQDPDDFMADLAADEQQRKERAGKAYRFSHIADRTEVPGLPYLLKGILNEKDIGLIHGDPGSGKSFLALDISLSVARGMEAFGYRTRRGPVTYLCAESAHGFSNRLAAYRHHHELNGAAAGSIPFYTLPASPKLSEGSDWARVVQTLADIETYQGEAVKLLLIDTISAVMQGADENSSEGMGALLSSAKRIRDAIGCAVVLIHHDAKGTKDARGHGSLKGDVDCIIQVERSGDQRTFTVKKSKEGRDGQQHCFRLNVVELGTDEDGDPITSCVVEPSDDLPAKATKGPRLTPQQQIALKCLRAALEESGFQSSETLAAGAPPYQKAVTLNDWRNQCGKVSLGGDEPKSRYRAFTRARETMQAAAIVGIGGDYVWINQ